MGLPAKELDYWLFFLKKHWEQTKAMFLTSMQLEQWQQAMWSSDFGWHQQQGNAKNSNDATHEPFATSAAVTSSADGTELRLTCSELQ